MLLWIQCLIEKHQWLGSLDVQHHKILQTMEFFQRVYLWKNCLESQDWFISSAAAEKQTCSQTNVPSVDVDDFGCNRPIAAPSDQWGIYEWNSLWEQLHWACAPPVPPGGSKEPDTNAAYNKMQLDKKHKNAELKELFETVWHSVNTSVQPSVVDYKTIKYYNIYTIKM